MSTATTYQRAKEVFSQALEATTQEREALVERACARDPAVAEAVREMLAVHARMGGFLERPAVRVQDAGGPRELQPQDRVGAYRIVRRIASGGGGTVYEAEQANPRRSVALKVMHAGLGSRIARRRFEAEAEILARLEHPDVAHVYDAGVYADDGIERPYFAMEYLADARSLTRHVREEDLPEAARIELMIRVCRAVHHGHQKGIVHRDVKPGNVLVDRAGNPRLIDFGIAQRDGGPHAGVAGTSEYMSPEQCGPDATEVDVRSDVYSLGALLYHVLVGRTLRDLRGLSFSAAAERVRETPLPEMDPALPAELRAIVARAMARRRADRYASASGLANDLSRYLAREPVAALPPTLRYQMTKFAQRHAALVLALATTLVVAVTAAVFSAWQAHDKELERRDAELQTYVANLAAAAAALREFDSAEARRRLDLAPVPRRGWEWEHLQGRLDMSRRTFTWPGSRIRCGTLSADGALVVAAGHTGATEYGIRVWDYATGDTVATFACAGWPWAVDLDASGTLLAVGFSRGAPRILDLRSGEERVRLDEQVGPVNRIAFLDDGTRVVTAGSDGTVQFWRAADGALLETRAAHADRTISLDLDERTDLVASGARSGEIRLHAPAGERGDAVLLGHEKSVEGLALSPSGEHIVSGSRDLTVRLWSVAAKRLDATLRGHTANVRDVAFAPDGRTVASCSHDRTVRLWSVDDRREIARLTGHAAFVNAVRYHPTRNELVSFSNDGTVKVWRVEPRDDVRTLRAHRETVAALAFSADGRRMVSGDNAGSIHLWDLEDGSQRAAPPLGGTVQSVAFDPRRRAFVAATRRGELAVVDLSGEVLARSSGWGYAVPAGIVRSGDALRTLSGGHDGVVRLLDVHDRTRDPLQWEAHGERVFHAAQHAASGRVVTTAVGGEIRVWTAPAGRRLASLAGSGTDVSQLALDPAGRTLAAGYADGAIALFDSRTLRARGVLEGHTEEVRALVFSPDGRRLASGSADASVRIWDPREQTELLLLREAGEPVYCLAWNPSGDTLASGGGVTDCHIKLWSAAPRTRK